MPPLRDDKITGKVSVPPPDTSPSPCASDEQLELYSMARLSEEAGAPLEEHLLSCFLCQERLDETDLYIKLMKQETARLLEQAAPPRRLFLQSWLPSKPAWAVGFALVVIAAGISWQTAVRPGTLPPQRLELQARRGVQTTSHASPKRLLTLKMDLTELPASDTYQVEVVNATGAPVWWGTAKPQGHQVEVALGRDLKSGMYWVRLYGSGNQYLREYGLRVD